MKITFLKNNTTYDLSEPYIYKSNYNETLDSLSCRLVHIGNKFDLMEKDKALIDEKYYMLVAHYDIIEETIGEVSKKYTYELELCSETKDLEGVVLPALSITPLKENPRSITYYLSKYNNEYGDKIRRANGFYNKWHFSANCLNWFRAIPAPEKQWGVSTFREVITDLMQVADCIPVLKNGEIDFIDLTTIKNPITHYNYLRYSNDLSSHTSELQMNMQNVLQTKIEGVNNKVITYEIIPFTSDEYVLTSDNLVLKTKYPILNIKKLEMINYKSYEISSQTNPVIKRRDFCNIDGYSLVSEAKEYQTKEVLYTTGAYDSSKTGEYYSKYQNYCAYFTRGSNEITGFNKSSKRWSVLSFSYQTYQWWQMINYGESIGEPDVRETKYYDTWFYIEYETQANQVFRTSKDEKVNPHITIDNQTNEWVDAYAQGNLEKQKANRLANEIVMLNQRWKKGDTFNPVEIGDYLEKDGDKLIAYQVQQQVYPDHIEVNAFLTKNYILRDVFTGVNSKIRTWKNATDEAFQKEMLDKLYCEFSFTPRQEVGLPNAKAEYLISPLNDYENKPVKYALIDFDADNSINYPGNNERFILDLIARQIGNSLVFTTKLDDNTIVRKYIELNESDLEQYDSYTTTVRSYKRIRIIDTSLKGGGLKQQNYKYVDDNYENIRANISIYDDLDLISLQNNDVLTVDELKKVFVNGFSFPKVAESVFENKESCFTHYFNNLKDNKEIPSYTMQYEFLSETKDLYATRYYVQNQKAISNVARIAPNVAIVEYQFGKIQQERDDRFDLDYEVEVVSNTIAKITIHNENLELQDNEAYSIGLDDKNWIVVKPQNKTGDCVFYLNILKNRDVNIYNNDNEVVGEI